MPDAPTPDAPNIRDSTSAGTVPFEAGFTWYRVTGERVVGAFLDGGEPED